MDRLNDYFKHRGTLKVRLPALLAVVTIGRKHIVSISIAPVIGQCGACCPCVIKQHLVEGTVIPGHVRTSMISIFIAFLNRSCQSDVVCITIYLKLLIIDRETNRQSSTGSNVGLVPWVHAELGSDADDLPLLLIF